MNKVPKIVCVSVLVCSNATLPDDAGPQSNKSYRSWFWQRQFLRSGHWRDRSEFTLCPQSVSSTDLSCCALHEWPVFPPRGGTDDFAIAAFSLLRARAARIPNSQIGLIPAVSCKKVEWPV